MNDQAVLPLLHHCRVDGDQWLAHFEAAEGRAIAGVDAQRVETRRAVTGELGAQVIEEFSLRAEGDLGEAALGLRVVGAGNLGEDLVGQ